MIRSKKFLLATVAASLLACAEQSSNTEDNQNQVEATTQAVIMHHEAIAETAAQGTHKLKQYNEMTLPGARISHAVTADSMAALSWSPTLPPPGMQQVDTENYQHYQSNGVVVVGEHPVSTFSIDVDTAAYSNIRRMLVQEGRLPPHDAVRVEEMINYFDYGYTNPQSGSAPFAISTEVAPSPWSDNRKLLRIGLKGFLPVAEKRPAANLVFLVDVSGSMRTANKLGLVKQSLRLLLKQMTARDSLSLVVYAGAAGTVLEATPGDQKAKIMAAIDALQAGGSTHGSAGIELAYALAQQNMIEGGINRVLIASDGDMNVGTVDINALKNLVAEKRKTGISLTTLGFGAGNYNDALMEQIANVGNGNAAYIDSLREAQKVLVNEMQATLLTIASDVKIQIEFNPAVVSEYRLIGYENRMLQREDFANDKVDAGDIGAGHTVTALYEISLLGDGGEQVSALRYQDNANASTHSKDEIALIKLRYKKPGEQQSIELTRVVHTADISDALDNSSEDLRFAASVAGFAQLLRGGQFTANWSYGDALILARSARGEDPHGYRGEFISLIELTQSLSSQI